MKETYLVLKYERSKNRGAPGPQSVSLEVDLLDPSDADRIRRLGDVHAAVPAIPMKLIRGLSANPRMERDVAWGLDAIGALRSPFSGRGVIVAVLDTGIDASHAAFEGIELVRKNFTNEGADDIDGHGTHCAGTIFGRDVNGTRIGVARGVTRALIAKVLGARGADSVAVLQAVWWSVESGSHVISLSLEIDFPSYQAQLVGAGYPADLATSRALEGYRRNVDLFQSLSNLVRARASFGQPTLLIGAAGNESRVEGGTRLRIAVGPPAVADGFISVAALDRGARGFVAAPFSNSGASISAPGVDIVSARLSGGLSASSGTSMAAPHVAGAAALWIEQLRRFGPPTATTCHAKVVGSAATTDIAPGWTPEDVGAGMVQCPHDDGPGTP